jgi:adenylosuccinate lyase
MATENLMMAAVQAGGDRQEVHELVRQHSHAVTAAIKEGTGTAAALIDRLKGESAFAKVDFAAVLAPRGFVGRAPEQVGEFVAEYVAPIRKRYAAVLGMKAELNV